MSVIMDEAGLYKLLIAPGGPVGTYVEQLAKRVADRAVANASASGPRPFGRGNPSRLGPYTVTRDLVDNLKAYGPFHSREGAYWHVGSTATHDGIAYPRLIEKGGFAPSRRSTSGFIFYRYPYLEPALAPDFVQVG